MVQLSVLALPAATTIVICGQDLVASVRSFLQSVALLLTMPRNHVWDGEQMSHSNQAGEDRGVRLPIWRTRQVAGSRLSLIDEAGDCRIQRSRPLPDWHAQRHGGDSWRQVIQHQPVQACALSSSSTILSVTCHMTMVQQHDRLQNVLAKQRVLSGQTYPVARRWLASCANTPGAHLQ